MDNPLDGPLDTMPGQDDDTAKAHDSLGSENPLVRGLDTLNKFVSITLFEYYWLFLSSDSMIGAIRYAERPGPGMTFFAYQNTL